MDWKRELPDNLFYVSGNGLVIPRYISKPVFSITLLGIIHVVIVLIIIFIPFLGGNRIWLPESAHPQFQFMDDRTSGNFLVTVHMSRDSTIWISDVPINDPDSPALAAELACQFKEKKKWLEQLRVPYLQKRHFQNMGYILKKDKLFLYADLAANWGKVISILKAARAAGVYDVCFLTEEMICPGSSD